jgi:hypothetical protein
MSKYKVGDILEYTGKFFGKFTLFVTQLNFGGTGIGGTVQTAGEGCPFREGFLVHFGMYPFVKIN